MHGGDPYQNRLPKVVGTFHQEHGYRIIPVNPKETAVLGERAYPSVQAIPERVDVVDVFRPHGRRSRC